MLDCCFLICGVDCRPDPVGALRGHTWACTQPWTDACRSVHCGAGVTIGPAPGQAFPAPMSTCHMLHQDEARHAVERRDSGKKDDGPADCRGDAPTRGPATAPSLVGGVRAVGPPPLTNPP